MSYTFHTSSFYNTACFHISQNNISANFGDSFKYIIEIGSCSLIQNILKWVLCQIATSDLPKLMLI